MFMICDISDDSSGQVSDDLIVFSAIDSGHGAKYIYVKVQVLRKYKYKCICLSTLYTCKYKWF